MSIISPARTDPQDERPRTVIPGHRWLAGGVLVVVVLVAGAPTLRGQFVWDDAHQIVESEAIRSLTSIPSFFDRTVREGVGAAYEDTAAPRGLELYRPVFVTLLAVEYALAGGAEPLPFHLMALLWHLAVVLLVWRLTARWTAHERGAFVGALLFGLHPVTAEAWLFVSAQCELVAAWCLLAAMACVEGRLSGKAGWLAAAAAAVFLLVGLLAKETILMALPPVCLALWLGRGVAFARLVPWGGAAVVFVALRTAALGGGQEPSAVSGVWAEALAHLPLLLGDALRALLTFAPVGYRELALEYAHASPLLAGIAGGAVLAVGTGVILVRRAVPTAPVAAGVFVLMLAPVALVSTVPSWGGFGRYLYVPLAFGVVAAVQASVALVARMPSTVVARAAVIAAVAACLVLELLGLRAATLAYRTVDEMADAAIVAAPGAATGYVNHGNTCMKRGQLERAVDHYRQALVRNPELHYVSQNLAVALIGSGHPEEGLEVALALERQQGRGPRSSFAVASALWALDRQAEARERVDWALELAPADDDLLWLHRTMGSAAGVPP